MCSGICPNQFIEVINDNFIYLKLHNKYNNFILRDEISSEDWDDYDDYHKLSIPQENVIIVDNKDTFNCLLGKIKVIFYFNLLYDHFSILLH